MTTVYIKGKGNYKEGIAKSLRKSDLKEGDHYIWGASSSEDSVLYWITSRITLREFKKAIRAKIIWKYRLRFYVCLKPIDDGKINITLTKDEIELMNTYKKLIIPA